jgi:hypothetical protein
VTSSCLYIIYSLGKHTDVDWAGCRLGRQKSVGDDPIGWRRLGMTIPMAANVCTIT